MIILGNWQTVAEAQGMSHLVVVFINEILEIDTYVMYSSLKIEVWRDESLPLFITADLPTASRFCHNIKQ